MEDLMEDCVFCQIVAGKIPCYKIYEDSEFLAFLDIHPVSAGHTLVIPKKHFRWVWEVKNYNAYFGKVREMALLLKEKLRAEWVQMGVMGIDIPHAHVHLIPHYQEQESKQRDLKEIVEKIKIKKN